MSVVNLWHFIRCVPDFHAEANTDKNFIVCWLPTMTRRLDGPENRSRSNSSTYKLVVVEWRCTDPKNRSRSRHGNRSNERGELPRIKARVYIVYFTHVSHCSLGQPGTLFKQATRRKLFRSSLLLLCRWNNSWGTFKKKVFFDQRRLNRKANLIKYQASALQFIFKFLDPDF